MKKIYMKPEMKAVEINNEAILLSASIEGASADTDNTIEEDCGW